MTPIRLPIDHDELASCVGCGLCLPHCPTWRVTGDEARSPRGRIAAMRAVELEGAPLDDAFVAAMDSCVQCRGCEPACPSAVPFGHLIEGARAGLTLAHRDRSVVARTAFRALGSHRVVVGGSIALALLQRLGVVPRALGLPRIPLRRPVLEASGDDVWLFPGCVMDAWQRDVHVAAARLIEATGAGVALPATGGDCCGALAAHGGLLDDARRLADRVIGSMPGDAPIVVDSAGCGAMLADYGRLLGTERAATFAARVVDVSTYLAGRLDALEVVEPVEGVVAVHDPCHLRHVQRAHLAVRQVLAPVAELVELDDEGLCCGAGGAYAALEPELATAIRERKLAAIARTGAAVVASANPGCSFHLAAAGLEVRHPVELAASAYGLVDPSARRG